MRFNRNIFRIFSNLNKLLLIIINLLMKKLFIFQLFGAVKLIFCFYQFDLNFFVFSDQ